MGTADLISPKFVQSEHHERKAWLGVLARSDAREVAARWTALKLEPDYQTLRPPETGLVMVRGRAGGTGDAFNLGEMTATRAVIRLSSGETGVGYVSGRDKKHALTAALADALLQSPDNKQAVMTGLIAPLASARDAARREASRKAAATKVEFFTMVRDRSPKK